MYQEYQYKVYRHIAYDPDLKKSLVPLDTFQKWRGDVIRQENSIHKSKGLSLKDLNSPLIQVIKRLLEMMKKIDIVLLIFT